MFRKSLSGGIKQSVSSCRAFHASASARRIVASNPVRAQEVKGVNRLLPRLVEGVLNTTLS
jgi:hypothetical protein